jgi:hypothetical protein
MIGTRRKNESTFPYRIGRALTYLVLIVTVTWKGVTVRPYLILRITADPHHRQSPQNPGNAVDYPAPALISVAATLTYVRWAEPGPTA